MKAAAHTMSTPGLTLLEALPVYAKLGYDGVEILYTAEYSCALHPAASAADIAELGDRLRDHGLEAAQITPYAKGFDDDDAAIRTASADEVLRCVDLAHQLGATTVRIWAGSELVAGREERQYQLLVDSLQRLAPEAGKSGVSLCIENHVGSQAITSANTVQIIEDVGSEWLAICYDPGNLLMLGEADAMGALERQLPHIRHVHFKDLRVLGNRKHTPCLVGEGDVPWSELMPRLVAGGYRGYFSTEFEKRWHPELLPEPDVGLAHELGALRALWSQAGAPTGHA